MNGGSATRDERAEAADTLWRLTAHPAQRPPEGPWRTWLFLGGRGAGKTRAGAEWLAARARPGARLALVGPTLHDVREVMAEGTSGLLRLPGRPRPRWEAVRRRLVWPNGAVAYAFSAEDPDSLRGPQFHAAWADEFCAWRRPGETLALLRMGLRLGNDPRLAVTTTPRPIPALRALVAEPLTVRTDAPTGANAANLSPAFLEDLKTLYGGTRLAAQELDGRLLEGEGALWRAADLERARVPAPPGPMERVVVAVDPPAGMDGDACGIVVAGRVGDRAWVLADRTTRGLSPLGWARRVADAATAFGASRIVAEANQGGEMVRACLSAGGAPCPVRLAHAARGKRARAEPVAALYEQGRVLHAGVFTELEEELLALGSGGGECGRRGASPDRADALVWAITDLLIHPAGPRAEPRIRLL
ncbi:MAG TPA: terminase family protein [Caulobacteraceae bacterium]|nr:terminase family protein [Caulobacteraceae bacterium]